MRASRTTAFATSHAGFTSMPQRGMVRSRRRDSDAEHSWKRIFPGAPADWAKAMTDPAAFAQEQAMIGHVWISWAFASGNPATNDWFTVQLGGRSIFVQRFEQGLRAFENRCAHRFFPLRTAPRGNGAIVCGFHHWRYNADGQALGIPKCIEMYGRPRATFGARLERWNSPNAAR